MTTEYAIDEAIEGLRSRCLELIESKTGEKWTIKGKRDGWDFQFRFYCDGWSRAAPSTDCFTMMRKNLGQLAEVWASLIHQAWRIRDK